MTNYRDRVQVRAQTILEADEHVLAAVPVMDGRLAGVAMIAAMAGGATGLPWVGAVAVLVAFTVLRRRHRATGLELRAAMVLAVTEHRVIALRATVWNGPRDVLWTVDNPERALDVKVGQMMSSISVETEGGRLSFAVPWIQRRRAQFVQAQAHRN